MKDLKISFCTICMNRLHHLQQTMVQNIKDNITYTNLEFVLLDYNSNDGLSSYVRGHLSKYIDSGLLKYYRTSDPSGYHVSHSRNMVFTLATGDVVCNIDADNFTGEGFAAYVNSNFVTKKDVFLSTHQISGIKNDVIGRICVRKQHFLHVNGYDEKMLHYGFEDIDLANRLEAAGLQQIQIDSIDFLRAIEHPNSERTNNFNHAKAYQQLIINYISPYESELLLLFDKQQYVRAKLIDNKNYNILHPNSKKKRSTKYKYSIREPEWEKGVWEIRGKAIVFIKNRIPVLRLHSKSRNMYLSDLQEKYYLISSPYMKETILFFYNQLANRIIMERNFKHKNSIVNIDGFGGGVVTRNFEAGSIQL